MYIQPSRSMRKKCNEAQVNQKVIVKIQTKYRLLLLSRKVLTRVITGQNLIQHTKNVEEVVAQKERKEENSKNAENAARKNIILEMHVR